MDITRPWEIYQEASEIPLLPPITVTSPIAGLQTIDTRIRHPCVDSMWCPFKNGHPLKTEVEGDPRRFSFVRIIKHGDNYIRVIPDDDEIITDEYWLIDSYNNNCTGLLLKDVGRTISDVRDQIRARYDKRKYMDAVRSLSVSYSNMCRHGFIEGGQITMPEPPPYAKKSSMKVKTVRRVRQEDEEEEDEF